MSFDELSDDQKLEVKGDFMVRLADKGRFIETMKAWHPEEYADETEERGPSWGEMADAESLVPDDVMRDEGVDYTPDDFMCSASEPNEAIENVPQWAVPYLENNDASGLEEHDKELVDKWRKKLEAEGLTLLCPLGGTENEFCACPAFGQATSTVDYVAHRNKKEEE